MKSDRFSRTIIIIIGGVVSWPLWLLLVTACFYFVEEVLGWKGEGSDGLAAIIAVGLFAVGLVMWKLAIGIVEIIFTRLAAKKAISQSPSSGE